MACPSVGPCLTRLLVRPSFCTRLPPRQPVSRGSGASPHVQTLVLPDTTSRMPSTPKTEAAAGPEPGAAGGAPAHGSVSIDGPARSPPACPSAASVPQGELLLAEGTHHHTGPARTPGGPAPHQSHWCSPAHAEGAPCRPSGPPSGTHHLDGLPLEVSLGHQPLLVGDVQAFLRQRLDHGVVAQERLGRVALEDEAPRPAVQLGRQQQVDHGGLDVLLVVLVRVEGLSQLLRHILCREGEGEAGAGSSRERHTHPGVAAHAAGVTAPSQSTRGPLAEKRTRERVAADLERGRASRTEDAAPSASQEGPRADVETGPQPAGSGAVTHARAQALGESERLGQRVPVTSLPSGRSAGR